MAKIVYPGVTAVALVLFFVPEIFGQSAATFSKPPFPRTLHAAALNVEDIIQRMRERCAVTTLNCDEARTLRTQLKNPGLGFRELYRSYNRYLRTVEQIGSSGQPFDWQLNLARHDVREIYLTWSRDSSANRPAVSGKFNSWYEKVGNEFLDVELQQEEMRAIENRLEKLFKEEIKKANVRIPPWNP